MVLDALFGPDISSYDAPLELARRWGKSRDRAVQEKAVDLLTELRDRFPLAADVVHELALVEMDLFPDRVQATLKRAADTFKEPNEELLCRLARVLKEKGDRHLGRKEFDQSRRAYADAATLCLRSYNIRDGQYPGINLATLCLMQAGVAQQCHDPEEAARLRARSQELARKLLGSRRDWHDDVLGDRDFWHPATEAEAHLLLQEWTRAGALYHAIAPGWERDSMKRQVDRILTAWRALGEVEFGPFNHLPDVFPPERPRPV
jgi:hypothetical protein